MTENRTSRVQLPLSSLKHARKKGNGGAPVKAYRWFVIQYVTWPCLEIEK